LTQFTSLDMHTSMTMTKLALRTVDNPIMILAKASITATANIKVRAFLTQ